MYIEQSAYNSLEISKITALISRRCRSELGALVAENIAPAADLSELTKRRELFADVEKYRGRKGELWHVCSNETCRHRVEVQPPEEGQDE